MAYAGNNEPLVSVFDAIGINEKVVENAVPLLSPQYQRPVLTKIIDQLKGGTIMKSDNRQYTIYRQENDYPYATINARAAVGTSLKLTLSQTDFSAIALGNAVYANSGAIGKVVSKENGILVVTFVANPNGATAFASTDFAVGESVIDGGDLGSAVNRISKETIFSLPDPYKNIIQVMNASAYIAYDEQHTKTYLPASNGKRYYAYQKEVQALERLQQQYVKRMLSNTPAVFNGNEPVSASLLNQILTMGGTQVSLGETASFSVSQFQDVFRTYTAAGGFTTNEILGICGPNYLANFQQTFSAAQIQYVGISNTVGGQTVKGIDFIEYGFMGLSLKLIVDPILGNQRMWGTASNGMSKRSNSCIYMNTAEVKTENMGNMPFATSRYFGTTADIKRSIIRGVTDENGNPNMNAANPQAGVSYEFKWDKVDQLSNPRACLYHGA